MPTSTRSPDERPSPNADTSLPTTATPNRAAAMPITLACANWPMSASIPICRKNTGMNRCPTGVSSRRIRSAAGLRPSDTPATNAPTIGASLAALASSEMPSVNASATATNVPADRLARATSSNRVGAIRTPIVDVTTRNATASPTTPATVRTDTVPSATTRTTTVRITSPITSSATAAPRTVRASIEPRARRSPKTRAVMPTLVAVSAAPTNSASLPVMPSSVPAP